MKLQDAYSLLGIEPGCNGDDIRKAFRKQALIWHPDKNSNSEECTEMFQRIQTAYAKLTRELSGEYGCGTDTEDDDYYDEYDDEGEMDDEDCDYDCDCFFHGGIPPWEFFEQLFAAMESGQYNGYPPGFPFHEGAFSFPRSGGGMNRAGTGQPQPQPQHTHTHSQAQHHNNNNDGEAEAYYDHTYAYESREERRHREREEQKLEKMWRKEMEMAERENIRAANAAKAAKSLAQQRNITAWMRQMPRPTMASRDDATIELVLVRKGVATDELPDTCVGKLETRKNGENQWAPRIIDKDTNKVKVENLEPGTSYFFRVCSGQQHSDGSEEWGDWSVESRYATTGKAPSAAPQHESAPERGRKAKHNVALKASKSSAGNGGGAHNHLDAQNSNGAAEAEEERLRKEEKDRAIQKALEAAAAEYEETQKSFLPADMGTNKKKKKKKKGKGTTETASDNATPPTGNQALRQPPQQQKQPSYQPPLKASVAMQQMTPAEVEAAENEELTRALEESLSMYNDSVAAKEAVAGALRQAGAPLEKISQQQKTSQRGPPGPHLWATSQQPTSKGNPANVLQQLPKPVPLPMPQPVAASLRKSTVAPGMQPSQLNGKMLPPPYQQQQQQHVRSPTICKFYNSEQGCKWGLNCKFQHLDKGAVNALKGPFKVGSANGNGASNLGFRYVPQNKLLHDHPQQQQQQQPLDATHAPSLPSTLFPDNLGPFAPPPPPPPPMQQPSGPSTSLPIPQPIGGGAQLGNLFGFTGDSDLPVPMPLPGKQQHLQAPGTMPQPFPVNHGLDGLGSLEDHQAISALFPPASALTDPTDATSTAGSFLGLGGTSPAASLGVAGWGTGVSAAGGFPGFVDFGMGQLGVVGKDGLGSDPLAEPQELPQDIGLAEPNHIAALDAEAFLNSVSIGQDEAQQLSAAAALAPGTMGKLEAQDPYRTASAASARPRYNPVGSYNPLAQRGPI